MTRSGANSPAMRWAVFFTGVMLGLGLTAGLAAGNDRIDPEADHILKAMATHLSGLQAFTVDADVDSEVIDLNGQNLQLSSSVSIMIERPGKFYVKRQGIFAEVAFLYDGKMLTLHETNHNVYVQREQSGTIDDAIHAVEVETGLDAPGADLLYTDAYAGLVSGVVSGTYRGTGFVNGVECHYLTFRQAQVDWQLWVQVGEVPLPMKYVINSKWVTGAPQYQVRYRNWNTKPEIDATQFTFTVPEGAKRLESVPQNDMGEFLVEGAKR